MFRQSTRIHQYSWSAAHDDGITIGFFHGLWSFFGLLIFSIVFPGRSRSAYRPGIPEYFPQVDRGIAIWRYELGVSKLTGISRATNRGTVAIAGDVPPALHNCQVMFAS
jgi:hypothetical protein